MAVNHLYLHAGLPKTGSSSIQLDLFVNRSELLDQDILYPDTGLLGPGHHILGHYGYPGYKIEYLPELYHYETDGGVVNLNALSEADRRAQSARLLDELITELQNFGGNTAVLSSEAFSNWEQEQIDVFCKTMKSASVGITLIFYLRRQDELLDSLLGQNERVLLRRLNTEQDIEDIIEHNAFDFRTTLAPWVESIGRESIRLKSFHRLRAQDRLNSDFRLEIGIKDLSRLHTLEPANTSLSRDSLDYLIERAQDLDSEALRSLDHLLGDFSEENPDDPKWRSRLSPAMRQQVVERFRPSNFMLAIDFSTTITDLIPEAPVNPDESWIEYPGLSDDTRATISEYIEHREQRKAEQDEMPD